MSASASAGIVPIYIPLIHRALGLAVAGEMLDAAETLTTAAEIMVRCDDPRAAEAANLARELLAQAC